MNQEFLEHLLEAHEEQFGTRPTLDGLSEMNKILKLDHALANNYPVEFEEDNK
jgi:hypothetical protein